MVSDISTLFYKKNTNKRIGQGITLRINTVSENINDEKLPERLNILDISV
jgi:hypothetical protein